MLFVILYFSSPWGWQPTLRARAESSLLELCQAARRKTKLTQGCWGGGGKIPASSLYSPAVLNLGLLVCICFQVFLSLTFHDWKVSKRSRHRSRQSNEALLVSTRHHSVASFTAFGELKLHSLQKLKRAWFSLVCINLFIVVFTLKIRERGNSLFTH